MTSTKAIDFSRVSNSILKPAALGLALMLSSSLAFAVGAPGESKTADAAEASTTHEKATEATQSAAAKTDSKADKKTETHKDSKKSDSKKSESKDKAKGDKAVNPHVIMETSLGNVEIELFEDKAPISVKNFLKYTDEGFYSGTIFHRVIPNFMIQGGGFTEKMDQKKTADQIKNEANNGLKNDRGTLAMARTGVVDSATSQFFINVKDNDFLNFTAPNPAQYGYAVFGKVISGMDIVDKIKEVPTGNSGMHSDVPKTPVVIKSMKRK